MIACNADNTHSAITSRSADATERDRSEDLIEFEMQHDRLTSEHTRMEGDKDHRTTGPQDFGLVWSWSWRFSRIS
jgi:hypothetical protein